MTSTQERQPAIYIAHGGGPWPYMEQAGGQHDSLRTHLEALPASLPRQPDAVVIVTAHWEAPEFTVSSASQPSMIYDYGGFPAHTYEVVYAAAGAPDIARRIIELGAEHGIAVADSDRGFDHGVFVPLVVSWPAADVPVVSVSLRNGLDPAEHIAFGAALETLRDDNIVVIGSGLSVHDLSFRITSAQSAEFDAWIEDTMHLPADERAAGIARWADAPNGRAAHPREEHLLPLMTVIGAGGDDPVTRTYRGELYGWTTASYRFG